MTLLEYKIIVPITLNVHLEECKYSKNINEINYKKSNYKSLVQIIFLIINIKNYLLNKKNVIKRLFNLKCMYNYYLL